MRFSLLLLVFLFLGIQVANSVGQDSGAMIGVPMLKLSKTPDGISIVVSPHPDPLSVSNGGFAGLLSTKQFRDELQVTSDQAGQLESYFSELQERIDLEFGVFTEAQLNSKMGESIAAAATAIVSDYAAKTETILLPFQIKVLKQKFNSGRAEKKNSFLDVLRSSEIASRIDLKVSQEAELVKKNNRLIKSLEEKLDAIRKEYRRSLISDLTDLQKKELEGIFGVGFFTSTR